MTLTLKKCQCLKDIANDILKRREIFDCIVQVFLKDIGYKYINFKTDRGWFPVCNMYNNCIDNLVEPIGPQNIQSVNIGILRGFKVSIMPTLHYGPCLMIKNVNRVIHSKSLQQEMQARQMAANTTHHNRRKRLEEARRNAEKSKEKAARAAAMRRIRMQLPPLMLY